MNNSERIKQLLEEFRMQCDAFKVWSKEVSDELTELTGILRLSEREGWRYANELEQERKRLQEELDSAADREQALLEALEKSVVQNEFDMIMTGEECRSARALIAATKEVSND